MRAMQSVGTNMCVANTAGYKHAYLSVDGNNHITRLQASALGIALGSDGVDNHIGAVHIKATKHSEAKPLNQLRLLDHLNVGCGL